MSRALDLENQTAIVTGAGSRSGIGYAAARCLAEAGANVLLTDLAPTKEAARELDELATEVGENCSATALDVTNKRAIAAAVEHALSRWGRIDVVFNNAGTPVGGGPFLGLDDDAWNLSYRINVKGTVDVCRAVIPVMRRQGRGVIVNNASLAGLGGIANLSAYSATKFAVVGLTKCLAAEFGREGIRCNAVCPGMVWTDMGRLEAEFMKAPDQTLEDAKRALADQVPAGRWADPREIGAAVAFLASEKASYINGVALPVAGGLAPGV